MYVVASSIYYLHHTLRKTNWTRDINRATAFDSVWEAERALRQAKMYIDPKEYYAAIIIEKEA